MLEVHVVTSANRHLYEGEIDEHHQIRRRIYIEELQWRGLTPRADKREYGPMVRGFGEIRADSLPTGVAQ